MIACGGGGGGSPTAPTPPNIAGSWSGTWSENSLPSGVLTQMNLNQNVSTISASTITILGVTLNVEGSISIEGHFAFHNVPTPTGCGTMTGDMHVGGSSMSGTLELNSLACSSHAFLTGPLVEPSAT
jgi:hypothetical protein